MKILLTLALGLMISALPLRAEVFNFAVFGDTPYSDWERAQLPAMLAAMDQENLAFSIHLGDIKNGHTFCNDAVYHDILGLFLSTATPLIYVPGDNEWTDCHRKNNGGYDPLERLAFLRRLFFANDLSLGKTSVQRPLLRQRSASDGDYPENVKWQQANVLFLGLNIPGSDNNLGNKHQPLPEFVARNRANLAWLSSAFAEARQSKLAGVVIAIQANPEFEAFNQGHPNPGYQAFLQQLQVETLAFNGQVLLLHGDTHTMRIDQPLLHPSSGKPLPNFTRVESYGSPFMGWVRIRFDSANPQIFTISPRPWPQR